MKQTKFNKRICDKFNIYDFKNIKFLYPNYPLTTKEGESMILDLLLITNKEAKICIIRRNIVSKRDILNIVLPTHEVYDNYTHTLYEKKGYLEILKENENSLIKILKNKFRVNDDFTLSRNIQFVGPELEGRLKSSKEFEPLRKLALTSGFNISYETLNNFYNMIMIEIR